MKGLVDRARAQTALSSEEQAKAADALPGVAYFQRKRNETSSAKEFNQRLKAICQEAALDLQQAANGFRERRIVDPAAGQSTSEVISSLGLCASTSGGREFPAAPRPAESPAHLHWTRFSPVGSVAAIQFRPTTGIRGASVKFLLHCIFASSADPQPSVPAAGVSIVDAHGLRAAISCLDDSKLPLDVGRLLEYEKVVAAFHEHQPVIPLRYGSRWKVKRLSGGCWTNTARSTSGFFASSKAWRKWACASWLTTARAPRASESLGTVPSAPGATYLASLRKRHAAETCLTQEERALEAGICKALAGLYAQERGEASTIEGMRLSPSSFWYRQSLSPGLLKQVEGFQSGTAARFLLSGPWPPYNFV